MTHEEAHDTLRRRTYSTTYLGERIAHGAETATVRDLSVSFADIRGYTERSVSWPPEETIQYLESYYAMVTKA